MREEKIKKLVKKSKAETDTVRLGEGLEMKL